MSGAYGSAALDLHARGLKVIPVGGDDGKHPLVYFKAWKGQSRATVEQLASRFPSANVGVLTGLSRLTVIDCDDENTLADAESRFGKTPLVTRSPRGGGHLYFQSSGEGCGNLRRDGLNIDVKGKGGFVVAPPSLRPGVGSYRIERGSWDALGSLPAVRRGALQLVHPAPGAHQSAPEAVLEGGRNNALFPALCAVARASASLEALTAEAHGINAGYVPPLSHGEVVKTAMSVWKRKQEGTLYSIASGATLVFHDELQPIGGNGDALLLLVLVRQWHSNRPDPFALSPRAMTAKQVIAGWGERRYETAIADLLALGFLQIVHRGGRKVGDASLYLLGSPTYPNVINTLSPASPPEITREGSQ